MTTQTEAITEKKPKAIQGLEGVYARIADDKEHAEDYIIPSGQMQMNVIDTHTIDPETNERTEHQDFRLNAITGPDQSREFGIRDFAHGQIASRTNIPGKYYRRMMDEGQGRLLAENVNTWLQADPGKGRLLRTINGDARAMLSDRYRVMDNIDLVHASMEEFKSIGLEIKRAELSDTRLHLKAVAPIDLNLTREVRVGDPVSLGVSIRNSEVGHGALVIETMLYVLWCKNGMTTGNKLTDMDIRKSHLGGRNVEGILSRETIDLTNQALWAQVKDVIRATFDPARLDEWVGKLKALDAMPITDVSAATENIVEAYKMPEHRGKALLQHFIDGMGVHGSGAWGMVNAITAVAQDIGDHGDVEERNRMERIGGEISVMPEPHIRKLLAIAA